MNINLYRRRRLRSTQPILTRVQIRDLGRLMGITSFRQSVEFLMDPYNYFKLSKVKMAEIHQYLIEKNITNKKCPNTHIRQGDHARLLISILFPGYPIIRASEHHYRDLRENRSPHAKSTDLAYDQLPTTDKYERLDELFRADVDWYKHIDQSKSHTVEIPLKRLNRSVVVEGHASSNLNVRLFLYLWTSERMAWNPAPVQMFIDDVDSFNDKEKECNQDGFYHIDLTDKSSAIQKANRRSTGTASIRFEFKDQKRPSIRHVSVCAVVEKTPEELASQLYVQTAALYIGRAMERSSKNLPLAQQVQEKVIELLNPYDTNDKLILSKTEDLLIACGETFLNDWNDAAGEEQGEEEEEEVFAGGEIVSMLDPILLSRIQHPTRCIFCTHNTCFDAQVFFDLQVTSMQWKCPVCSVKIRGIQDLYIDYQTKIALKQYPNEEKFLKEGHTYLPVSGGNTDTKTRKYSVISLDEDIEEQAKKKLK
ncbi:uncharacterized protein B0P05DRAFT_597845 [Gilbertella persicaria]|uniref:uncharacterized protein n=1 Tax=Gilbertella persicaria TaxID=101096 RepID=UPI0022206575|nr:uncharacterized protein B0P05DRAFT_597845 [Gilbertella persicaria]KAI8075445.1 hypothetical protein B0P05DRAFT_597845 [Gilbertella persicaria]